MVNTNRNNRSNRNYRSNFSNQFQLSWQNIVMTIILFLSIGGAFWALAYNPIQSSIIEVKNDIHSIRNELKNDNIKTQEALNKHSDRDIASFLTQKEYTEFKERVVKKFDLLDKDIKDLEKSERQAGNFSPLQQAIITRIEDQQRRIIEALDNTYNKLQEHLQNIGKGNQ